MLLQVLYGAGIGISLALTGAGGSVIALPVLVYLLGIDPHAATGTSLVVVGLNAASAAVSFARAGLVRWRIGGFFALAGALGAVAGSAVNPRVPAAALMGGLAVFMGIVAVRMLRHEETAVGDAACLEPLEARLRLGISGFSVGFLTGLFGVGGGFLVVPSLVILLECPMRQAIGTSLFVIALNSLWGVAARLGGLGAIDLGPVPGLVLGGVIGATAGARLTARIDPKPFVRGFAVFLILVAIYVVVRTARGG